MAMQHAADLPCLVALQSWLHSELAVQTAARNHKRKKVRRIYPCSLAMPSRFARHVGVLIGWLAHWPDQDGSALPLGAPREVPLPGCIICQSFIVADVQGIRRLDYKLLLRIILRRSENYKSD